MQSKTVMELLAVAEPSSRSDKYEEYSILYGYYGTRSIIKKPYYIYSQGIYPITKGYNRLLVKWNLSKASYVSVRDEDSFLYLKELGIKTILKLFQTLF